MESLIRSSNEFYKGSDCVLVVRIFVSMHRGSVTEAFNRQGDIGLAAYNDLLRAVAHFHSRVYSDGCSKSGLNSVSWLVSLSRLGAHPIAVLQSTRDRRGTLC
jgi:hypothetical protein